MSSTIKATDEGSLATVSGILHDEVFELSGIQSNPEDGSVTIPVRRQHHDGPEELVERKLLSRTYEKNWMHSLVIVRGVREWRTLNDQGIDSYTLLSWVYRDGKISARANERLVLEFDVKTIDVELKTLGAAGRARIKRGPLGLERPSS